MRVDSKMGRLEYGCETKLTLIAANKKRIAELEAKNATLRRELGDLMAEMAMETAKAVKAA